MENALNLVIASVSKWAITNHSNIQLNISISIGVSYFFCYLAREAVEKKKIHLKGRQDDKMSTVLYGQEMRV